MVSVCDEATYEQPFTLCYICTLWVLWLSGFVMKLHMNEQYTLWVVMVVWVCEEVTYEQFTLWVVMVVLVLL